MVLSFEIISGDTGFYWSFTKARGILWFVLSCEWPVQHRQLAWDLFVWDWQISFWMQCRHHSLPSDGWEDAFWQLNLQGGVERAKWTASTPQIPQKALKSPSDDTPVCIFRMHRILQIHAWKLIWHWNILQFLQEIHLQMVDFPASHVNFRGGEVPPCFFSPCATLMPHWQNPKVATFPNKTPRGDVSPPTIS